MAPVRILLANLPRLLRDILKDAAHAAPGLELVEAHGGLETWLAAAGLTSPHVVVIGAEAEVAGGMPPAIPPAGLKLLVVSPEGRDAALYEVTRVAGPHRDLSPARLIALARAAATPVTSRAVGAID